MENIFALLPDALNSSSAYLRCTGHRAACVMSWNWILHGRVHRCYNSLSEHRNSRWVFSLSVFVFRRERHHEYRQNKTIWSGRCAASHSFSAWSWSLRLLSVSSTYGSRNMTTLCNPYKEQTVSHETRAGVNGSLPPLLCLGALPLSKSSIYWI